MGIIFSDAKCCHDLQSIFPIGDNLVEAITGDRRNMPTANILFGVNLAMTTQLT